jgi:hypothetical protein
MGLSKEVGQAYFSANSNASTGVLGDAIAQAGILGVVAITLAVIGIFLVLERIFLSSNSRLLLITSGLLVELMAETPLQTLMVTKGFLIVLLYYSIDVFQIFRRKRRTPRFNKNS